MLRTFSETELTEMCKKRPPDYRTAILELTTTRPDGSYELDTGSDAYFKLKNKYAGINAPQKFSQQARDAVTGGGGGGRTPTGMPSTVDPEAVYRQGIELMAVLGEASPFAQAYVAFITKERQGGCKSCKRSAELRKLVAALKLSLLGVSVERRQQVKAMFPGTEFIEVIPAPLKWDAIMN